MSRFEIKMPKLGESITEGTIVSWSVKVGDIIQEDDVLFEVNTAKVSAEIPSPVAGKVVEILFKEGDTVAVGTVVAVVDMGGEEDDSSEENVSDSHEKVFAESEIREIRNLLRQKRNAGILLLSFSWHGKLKFRKRNWIPYKVQDTKGG